MHDTQISEEHLGAAFFGSFEELRGLDVFLFGRRSFLKSGLNTLFLMALYTELGFNQQHPCFIYLVVFMISIIA